MIAAVRVLSMAGLGLGTLLTYNLLVPEAARIGPLLLVGPAAILGPLLFTFALGGYLSAGRSTRFLLRSGIGCCATALVGGFVLFDRLAVSPFLRVVVLSAVPILFGIGVVMVVHARDTRKRP